MPEALRKIFALRVAGVPLGKGLAYDVGISTAGTLISLIEAWWPGIPSSMLGLLVAWLVKLGVVERTLGAEVAELISVGGVYIASRESPLQLEPRMKGLVGGLTGQPLAYLQPETTSVIPMTTAVAPIAPALSALERQIAAIRA